MQILYTLHRNELCRTIGTELLLKSLDSWLINVELTIDAGKHLLMWCIFNEKQFGNSLQRIQSLMQRTVTDERGRTWRRVRDSSAMFYLRRRSGRAWTCRWRSQQTQTSGSLLFGQCLREVWHCFHRTTLWSTLSYNARKTGQRSKIKKTKLLRTSNWFSFLLEHGTVYCDP